MKKFEMPEGAKSKIKIKVGIGADGSTEILPAGESAKEKKPRIKVGLTDDGKVEIETKDPKIVIKNAEECFRNEDFEGAFIKLGFVEDEDIEKRVIELLGENDEKKKLAEDMYQNDQWREKAKEDWFNSSIIAHAKKDSENK